MNIREVGKYIEYKNGYMVRLTTPHHSPYWRAHYELRPHKLETDGKSWVTHGTYVHHSIPYAVADDFGSLVAVFNPTAKEKK
jgi:hypothetical protein